MTGALRRILNVLSSTECRTGDEERAVICVILFRLSKLQIFINENVFLTQDRDNYEQLNAKNRREIGQLRTELRT